MYWLVKEEMTHYTKFSSFLELGESLGCAYFNKLEVGKNASYTAHCMKDEFLSILPDCVQLSKMFFAKREPVLQLTFYAMSQLMFPV